MQNNKFTHDPIFTGTSQVALVVKNLPINAGYVRGAGSIPGLGRSPGKGKNTGVFFPVFWPGEVHSVAKSRTRLK